MMKNKILLTLCMSMPLFLVGCGGSDSPTSASSQGISSGTITGFGSVFVNGVKFNTDNATVTRGDDIVNSERDLEIGMIVRVEGDIQNRVASSISFEEDVKGPADGVVVGGILKVMGQTVITDLSTVLDEDLVLGDINAGDILEISGLRNVDDDIVASFIEKKANPADVRRYSVIGNVRELNTGAKTFKIDDLLVDYSTAIVNDFTSGDPVEGQLVEVKDDLKSYLGGMFTLSASKVEPHNRLGDDDVAGAEVEIESLVTEVISDSEFKIGDLTVQHSPGSTLYLFGMAANIMVGTRLEVEGRFDENGILQANKIKFEDNDARIQANVDSVNVAEGTVKLLGVITVSVTSTTEMEDNRDDSPSFSLADISTGDYLEIRGFIGANGDFIASELEREDNDDDVEIRGPVSAKDPVAGTVTILGVMVNTNGSQFEGLNDEQLTAEQFYAAIVEGLTVVKAKWKPFSDISQSAKELSLED
jgi:hypothetical protein